jgi:4-amino-4-deoxy-L-arabinose transferase-like glycosyltransferase
MRRAGVINDIAEGVVDGPEWQLSYLRHPRLSSWLSGLASTTGPWRCAVLFSIALGFACAAFAIGAGFIARVDRRAAGIVALMAGLASPYASYWPLKFNHNISVMPFWAMTIWAAWYAFEGGALGAWALLGVIVGLGLWAKYAILHLVIPPACRLPLCLNGAKER